MRRRSAELRETAPDPKYNEILAGKFINYMMMGGKKYTSERIFYEALKIAEEKTGKPGITVFNQAMNNVKPLLEVRPRRVGGATYQVPYEVRPNRAIALTIRWVVGAARAKKGKPMSGKLAEELLLALENKGDAYKKREDMHKMADANRAFAHFRW
ncbi:MAG: 30S ribosomal protein S7 [bacterium]